MIVPLVESGQLIRDTISNFVVLDDGKVSNPMGIYGKPTFHGGADPGAVVFFPNLFTGMNGIMHEDHAYALTGEFIKELPLAPVGAYVVGIDYDGISTCDHGLMLLGPVRSQDSGFHLEPALFVEGLRQQHAPGIELMLSGAMASVTCDEDDMFDVLFLLVGEDERVEECEQEGDNQRDTFHGKRGRGVGVVGYSESGSMICHEKDSP